MSLLSKAIKTMGLFLLISASLIGVSILTTYAQTADETPPEGSNVGSNTDEYLRNIMNNTYAILYYVKNLPAYLDTISKMALDWTNPDNSDTTANLQSNFTTLANAFLGDINTRQSTQPRILSTLFNNATAKELPYANDLAFQTLVGAPYFAKDPRQTNPNNPPDSAFNYLVNASGLAIEHALPDNPAWEGSIFDQNRYKMFYRTVMSAESFNAYVLSNAYAEAMQGGQFTTLQTNLITQASSPDWFQQVGSEQIGVVMRQILLYQSQTFVLLTQLLQTQKEALLAQAIGNALTIAGNMSNETSLIQRASRSN